MAMLPANPDHAFTIMSRSAFFVALSVLLAAVLTSCGRGKPGTFDRSGYHVRGGVVWFLAGWPSEAFEVKGADAASFHFPLPGGTEAEFGRDAKHVFLRGLVIPGADPATFEIVDHRFTRDSKQVYFSHHVFCDDPANFTRVSGNFVKNSRAVFLITQQGKGEVVSEDSANFREISGVDFHSFCADSNQVFVNGNPIPGAQPASFKVLGGAYARDATQTFYFDEPMPDGTDGATLQPLASGYAKDRGRAYYCGKVLEGADAATFEITDARWPKAKDRNRIYEQGEAKQPGS